MDEAEFIYNAVTGEYTDYVHLAWGNPQWVQCAARPFPFDGWEWDVELGVWVQTVTLP